MPHQLKDVFVGAWVEPQTKENLRQLAKLRGVNQSKLLRILIDDAMKRAAAGVADINGQREPAK